MVQPEQFFKGLDDGLCKNPGFYHQSIGQKCRVELYCHLVWKSVVKTGCSSLLLDFCSSFVYCNVFYSTSEYQLFRFKVFYQSVFGFWTQFKTMGPLWKDYHCPSSLMKRDRFDNFYIEKPRFYWFQISSKHLLTAAKLHFVRLNLRKMWYEISSLECV